MSGCIPALQDLSEKAETMIFQPTFPMVFQPMFPPMVVGIATPTNHDVICGRGAVVNSHPGNQNFRRIAICKKELYDRTSRLRKREIAMSIINTVRSLNPPGRFLEQNPKTGLWFEVNEETAIKKTCQTLRYERSAPPRERLLPELVASVTHAAPVVSSPAAKKPEKSQGLKGAGKKTAKRTNKAFGGEAARLSKEEPLPLELGDPDVLEAVFHKQDDLNNFFDAVFETEAHSAVATESTKQDYDKIPEVLDAGFDMDDLDDFLDEMFAKEENAHVGTKQVNDKRAPAVCSCRACRPSRTTQKGKPPAKRRQRTKRTRPVLKILKTPNNHPNRVGGAAA